MEGKELTQEETRFEHWFNTESSWKGSDALYLSEGRLARDAFMAGLKESQSLVSELTWERDGLREALEFITSPDLTECALGRIAENLESLGFITTAFTLAAMLTKAEKALAAIKAAGGEK